MANYLWPVGHEFYIHYASANDIPYDQLKHLHRQYWNFIADWNYQWKPIIASSINGCFLGISSSCFACEYAQRYVRENGISGVPTCVVCPLKKYRSSTDYALCISPGTPYNQFTQEEDLSTIQDLARQIANLEWEDMEEY